MGRRYRRLTPASDYNIDYAILASSRMEPLLRDIRLGMAGAGLRFGRSRAEVQHGPSRRSGFVTTGAGHLHHTIYKNGMEIADQHGKA